MSQIQWTQRSGADRPRRIDPDGLTQTDQRGKSPTLAGDSLLALAENPLVSALKIRDLPGSERRIIRAWCMYDWANSAFATSGVAAVLPVYFVLLFKDAVGESGSFLGITFTGSSMWSLAVVVSTGVVALGSPILGVISDRIPIKKALLGAFTALGAFFTVLVFFSRVYAPTVDLVVCGVHPGQPWFCRVPGLLQLLLATPGSQESIGRHQQQGVRVWLRGRRTGPAGAPGVDSASAKFGHRGSGHQGSNCLDRRVVVWLEHMDAAGTAGTAGTAGRRPIDGGGNFGNGVPGAAPDVPRARPVQSGAHLLWRLPPVQRRPSDDAGHCRGVLRRHIGHFPGVQHGDDPDHTVRRYPRRDRLRTARGKEYPPSGL